MNKRGNKEQNKGEPDKGDIDKGDIDKTDIDKTETGKTKMNKTERGKGDIKKWKEERKKNYKQVIFELERPIFNKFKVKCAKDNLTLRQVLTKLLERYMKEGLKGL